MTNRFSSINNRSIDLTTGATTTIDYPHVEIHKGDHYFIKRWYDVTGAGTNLDFQLVTPDVVTWGHITTVVTTEAEFTVTVYEAPTITADGTPIPVYNRNRNSTNTSIMLAYGAPTVGATGTTDIWSLKTGSGAGISTGERRSDNEIMLKQNTRYLLRINKAATGTDWVDLEMTWYEHADEEL
jgi:hypothetical protein